MLVSKEVFPVNRTVPVLRVPDRCQVVHDQWVLAEEVPVGLIYNGTPHAVMMATPMDLHEFAIGFTLSEEIATHPDGIEEIYLEPSEDGVRVFVSLNPDFMGPGLDVERNIAGRTSCGMCGLAELKGAVRYPDKKVERRFTPLAHNLTEAFGAFESKQNLFRVNRSVHGAAFCTSDGDIKMISEDVGRHNALDKLLGCLSGSNFSPEDGYILMSSRCSFELVKKAIVYGVNGLVTFSAPTGRAQSMARSANMFLAARAGDGQVAFFAA